MERMIYHDVLVQWVQLIDLAHRLNAVLNQQPVQQISYVGSKGWKWDVISTIAQKRGVFVQQKQSLTSRGRSFLAQIKQRATVWRETLQRPDPLHPSAEFIFLIPIARLAQALWNVIHVLEKEHTVQTIAESELGRMAVSSDVRALPNMQALEAVLSAVVWTENQQDEALAHALKNMVMTTLSQAMLTVSAMQKVLQASPQAVVVGSFVGEPLLEVARAMGRKTVVIQTCGSVEYIVHLAGKSRYLLASEHDRMRIQQGCEALDAVVVGHAGYDFPQRFSDVQVAEVRQRYGVKHEEKFLLFAGSYATPGLIEWESIAARSKLFLRAMQGVAGVKVVMKLHPYDHRLRRYEKMIEELEMKASVQVVQSVDVHDLLQAADAVVMLESTVGQESIVLGKALLDIPVLGDWFGYHASGASLMGHTLDAVRQHVSDMLWNRSVQAELAEGRARYLKQLFPMQDGAVVQRVVHELCMFP